jgi:hypothetical protein
VASIRRHRTPPGLSLPSNTLMMRKHLLRSTARPPPLRLPRFISEPSVETVSAYGLCVQSSHSDVWARLSESSLGDHDTHECELISNG